MKYYDWDDDKNNLSKNTRDVSFEEVVFAIANGKLLDVVDNTNKDKYPYQKMFVVEIKDYAYVVPFVEDEKKYFLKTIYPSREAVKKYLNREE